MNSIGPDLALDPLTGDLDLSLGDAHQVDDVAQAAAIRLKFVLGEWFLDASLGVPYWDVIWVKNPNLDHVRAAFLDALQSTPGIDAVDDLQVDLDPATRGCTVTWSADASGLGATVVAS